jgi:hypothetical protein
LSPGTPVLPGGCERLQLLSRNHLGGLRKSYLQQWLGRVWSAVCGADETVAIKDDEQKGLLLPYKKNNIQRRVV